MTLEALQSGNRFLIFDNYMHEVKHYADSLGIEFDGFCLSEADAMRCFMAMKREMDHAFDCHAALLWACVDPLLPESQRSTRL